MHKGLRIMLFEKYSLSGIDIHNVDAFQDVYIKLAKNSGENDSHHVMLIFSTLQKQKYLVHD